MEFLFREGRTLLVLAVLELLIQCYIAFGSPKIDAVLILFGVSIILSALAFTASASLEQNNPKFYVWFALILSAVFAFPFLLGDVPLNIYGLNQGAVTSNVLKLVGRTTYLS